MIDHQKVVLAGIVPSRKDLLLHAIQHLQEEHFYEDVPKGIFKSLVHYYNVAGDVMPAQVLSDLLARSKTMETSKALLFEEQYAEVAAMSPSDHEFRFSVDQLKDIRANQMTGEAITVAFEILTRGSEVGREFLEGHKEARRYFIEQNSVIEKLDNVEVAPEGDMRKEGKEVLMDYMDRKEGKTGNGVLLGLPKIDSLVGGFQPGELALVCAYTNQGKTQMCCQIAWHAAVMQGKNVFFATSETVRSTVRRRIIARHSRLPQFGLPQGLNANDIRDGSLSPVEEKALVAVIKDLDSNPNYGKLYIAQIPRGATMSYFEATMSRQSALWQIDLGIMDYLALLKSDRKRNSEREEFNEILKDAKTFATSFDEGRGVPLISPWQIKQEAYKQAQQTGAYGLASLSDTSEAEKSSDQIISLLRRQEQPSLIDLQFLKMRDGEIPETFTLETDFRYAYLGEKKTGSNVTSFAPATSLSSYL